VITSRAIEAMGISSASQKTARQRYLERTSLVWFRRDLRLGVKLGVTYPFPIVAHSETRRRPLLAFDKMRKHE
jgi:hypothetical protein